jgi:ParB-like chromosome segregation protein Spo0J
MRRKIRKIDLETLKENLEKGQDEPILVSDTGIVIDGHKRRLAFGLKPLKEIVKHHASPNEVLEDMIKHISLQDTKETILMKRDEVKKLFPDIEQAELVDILRTLTGKSRATIYRALGYSVSNETERKTKLKDKFPICAQCEYKLYYQEKNKHA